MEIELKIEKLGAQGDGVAMHDGQEVFVPFSVPGERVTAFVENGRSDTPKILEPSPDRIKPLCRHFKTCGGCATQHIRETVLAEWKTALVADALGKHGLTTTFKPTITAPPRSRRRAVFTAKRTKASATLGFHGRNSQVMVPIQDCPLLRPEITQSFQGLINLVELAATRKTEVRLGVTHSIGGLDVDITGAKPMDPRIHQEAVAIVHAHGFARLFWNNEIVLERQPAQHKFGNALVTPPNGAFLQATQEGEDALVKAIQSIVLPAKSIIDLFAGCGTFTLPLAQDAEVTAVESSQTMLAALDRGWRMAPGMKKVQTISRDLFRNPLSSDEFKKFDAIVIDPPRAGAREQVQEIAASKVQKIAFVSCNPATFARDARILVDAGYSFDWIQVVDQFLWSGHCELVAQFTRR
jgi:23S rRNA (uracil1939-C5)-methyltransferase